MYCKLKVTKEGLIPDKVTEANPCKQVANKKSKKTNQKERVYRNTKTEGGKSGIFPWF